MTSAVQSLNFTSLLKDCPIIQHIIFELWSPIGPRLVTFILPSTCPLQTLGSVSSVYCCDGPVQITCLSKNPRGRARFGRIIRATRFVTLVTSRHSMPFAQCNGSPAFSPYIHHAPILTGCADSNSDDGKMLMTLSTLLHSTRYYLVFIHSKTINAYLPQFRILSPWLWTFPSATKETQWLRESAEPF
ncbi:hypothetical protein M422DRAFT_258231 [Sphaerobolus stellatus SS14]|uniref:Uncharacterized protein n=1 Tax=Sphaerobolus stellatus (strain SS14) TaxID=990650 RepID=A0A0C9VBY4_SPHS4|nr:hypothetical protein M422DRAFT_258231 [Sphaerobolus stellatus SS14]